MKAKIASAQGACQGGVPASRRRGHTDRRRRPGVLRGGAFTAGPRRGQRRGLQRTASEDANYTARARRRSGGRSGPSLAGLVKAYSTPAVKFRPATHPAGWYQFSVLSAAANPQPRRPSRQRLQARQPHEAGRGSLRRRQQAKVPQDGTRTAEGARSTTQRLDKTNSCSLAWRTHVRSRSCIIVRHRGARLERRRALVEAHGPKQVVTGAGLRHALDDRAARTTAATSATRSGGSSRRTTSPAPSSRRARSSSCRRPAGRSARRRSGRRRLEPPAAIDGRGPRPRLPRHLGQRADGPARHRPRCSCAAAASGCSSTAAREPSAS